MRDLADDEGIVLRLLSPFEAWPKHEVLPEQLMFLTPLSLERWPQCDLSTGRQPTQVPSRAEILSPSRPRQSQTSASLPKEHPPSTNQRLVRMRDSFEKDKSVLSEDYEYFATPRESTPRNKAARKSAAQSERQSLERSETPSSDKTGD